VSVGQRFDLFENFEFQELFELENSSMVLGLRDPKCGVFPRKAT
jgi:hypothetical protein